MSIPTILVYGPDKFLIGTRCRVLKTVGWHAEAAFEFEAGRHILTEYPIEILILSHELSAEECELMENTARSLRPNIRLLYFQPSFGRRKLNPGDRLMKAFHPAHLISTVASMTSPGESLPVAGPSRRLGRGPMFS